MMIVLAVIGWVLLGFLALVVLLLAVPATISARYADKQFEVHVRIWFFRLRVYPLPAMAKKKPATEKKKKPEPEKAEDEDKDKKKRTPRQMLDLGKRLAGAGWAALKVFFRHARFHGIDLVLPVHAEDAADTARRCGQIQAAIGTVRAVLDDRLHIRYKRLALVPDFAGRMSRELVIAGKLTFCPGVALGMGIVFVKHYLASRPYSGKAYKRAAAARRKARQAAQSKARQAQNGKAA